ncbi:MULTISPECIES: hypothetical protein [Pseudomonas]|jgi:hypothetical protein|uniref:hypothetical protein n=1 Tax=Pseudomonas TaxID=286 RepID=UPI001AE23169|nr:hypothetical protein [Pseudomonas palmensis]
MTRTPITALLFAALLGAQATVALAAGTGPTNPAPGNGVPNSTLPGAGVDVPAPPNEPSMPSGTDPRTQGNDDGRQGGMNTDDTRGQMPEGTGSERNGHEGSESNNSGGVSGPAGS